MSWLLAFMAQFNTGLLTISLHFLNYYWNCLEEFLLIKNIVSLPANDQTVHNCSKILSFFFIYQIDYHILLHKNIIFVSSLPASTSFSQSEKIHLNQKMKVSREILQIMIDLKIGRFNRFIKTLK
jgi:hypothetical protein